LSTDKRQLNGDKAKKAGGTASPFAVSLQVAGLYFVISSIWVLFSDKLLIYLTRNAELIQAISMSKGILFIFVTATMLFFLIKRAFRKEADYSGKLDESYDRLQENYALLNISRDKLAASEEQYRQLFSAMLCGYCVNELVRDDGNMPRDIHTLNINPAFAEIAALAPGEPPEACFLRLLPGGKRFWMDSLDKVATEGKSMHFQIYSPSVSKYLEFTLFQPAPGRFAALINDITDRKQMEKALDAETQQLRVTLNSIGDGVVAVDTEGKITMLNGVAEQMAGLHHGTALGRPIEGILKQYGGAAAVRFAAEMEAALNHSNTSVYRGEIRINTGDGKEKLISCSAAPMTGSDGARLGFVTVIRDMTEHEQKEAEILYLSYHDPLTGLYNRAFFEEELKRLDTERQLPLSVIMGDANNLKLVNDVFGHVEGDELLRSLGQVLRESCRTEDIICRWGGDEFTILLPRTDPVHVEMICRRISETCKRYHTVDKNLNPSISLGYDTKNSVGIDINQVIKAAEDMMYKNKLLENRIAHNEFLRAMRKRINQIDLESEEHIGRLSELSERTGREMDLRENELADLKILSLLHDIGKVAINENILTKPGRLTEAEWEEIKRHSGIGYRIVRSAPELVVVADYILGHHERWDGAGYPQGLKGQSIPMPSRIFAVVDAFDAMTHERPYRQTLNQETALMELYRNAGTQFDPEVVYAFASVLNQLTDVLE
jgi:diguanylate cyclase (GGDEF)-like protein/PAS domain S-box-containing protein